MPKKDSGGQDSPLQAEDEVVRAFAEKFKIAPDLAKRLIDLHRAALERERRRSTRTTGPRRIS